MTDPSGHTELEESPDGFRIQDVWAILQMQRGVVLLGLVSCMAVAALYAITATRHYDARSVVHISTIANQEMEMGQSVENANLVWNRDLYIRTMIELVKSRSFRTRILERYDALWPEDGLSAENGGISLLGRSTSIVPRKGTELIDITVTTEDPELSARIANLTAQVLRDDRLEQFTQAAEGAKSWLVGQLADYENRIERAAAELLDYQRQHDLVDASDEETTLDAKMGTLNGSLAAANAQRVEQETLVRLHQDLLRQGNYDPLIKSIDSPMLAMLAEEHFKTRQTVLQLQSTYGPKWHRLQSAQQEADRAEEALRAEVERSIAAEKSLLDLYRAKERDLQAAVGGSKDQLLEVLTRYEGYEKKKLELETAKSLYARMKERMGELELQSKTRLNNIRVVEEARPPKKASSPDVLTTLVGGLVAGMLVGIGGAFAREWLDDSVSSPLDVSTYLRVPLLGMIPKIEKTFEEERERTLYTHLEPRSNVAEAVRALRTVIELNPTGAAPRRLLVTSALSSEGKTSTAIRLAIAFASTNRSVVIIDGDMRRPRIHKVFDEDRSPGFAEALAGEVSAIDCVRGTDVPGLSYMAAGRAGDRPNEAVAGTKLPEVLEELDRAFDLVIIDSPPSVLISDARVLSRHVDGVVVMCRERSTSRGVVREAIQGIQQVGGHIYGLVLNEIDMKRRGAAKYGYQYGYGYRYERYYDDDRTAAK
ncbi:MAG: polysaccharide biosynthesis tyrosine autokinase [Myxococcota bacterium]